MSSPITARACWMISSVSTVPCENLALATDSNSWQTKIEVLPRLSQVMVVVTAMVMVVLMVVLVVATLSWTLQRPHPQTTTSLKIPQTCRLPMSLPLMPPPTIFLDRLSEVQQARDALVETEEIIQRALAMIGDDIPPPVRNRYTELLMSSVVMHLRSAGDAARRLRQALEDV